MGLTLADAGKPIHQALVPAPDALAHPAHAEVGQDGPQAPVADPNSFRTGKAFSSGAVKGMYNKAKLAVRKAYGFRSDKFYELALYHTLADLPQHSLAH